MNESELLAAIRRKREEGKREIRIELEDVFDIADLLHHHAERWRIHLHDQHPISTDLMESPEACREMAFAAHGTSGDSHIL